MRIPNAYQGYGEVCLVEPLAPGVVAHRPRRETLVEERAASWGKAAASVAVPISVPKCSPKAVAPDLPMAHPVVSAGWAAGQGAVACRACFPEAVDDE